VTDPTSSGRNPQDPEYLALLLRLKEAEPGSPEAAQLVEQLHERYVEVIGFGGTTAAGLPYPLPTDPVAEGADAIRSLAEAVERATLNGSARARASAGTGGYPQSTWFTVPLDQLVEGSWQRGFSFANRIFTISTPGVYLMAAAWSMGSANFAIRIRNQASPATTLTQTSYGGTTSFTRDLATARWLPAGALISLDVFTGEAAGNSLADAADTPSYLLLSSLPYMGPGA
jgi:hypothetical protein